MIHQLVLSAVFLLGASFVHAAPAQPTDPTPATSVDLKKYGGTWFSIASIPLAEAKDCATDQMARYTEDNGLIKVVNSCRKSDGMLLTAEGRARPQDPSSTSRLQVTFVQENEVWNFDNAGPYWILEVAPNYSWAIVGGPQFKHAWILSRTPELKPGLLKKLNGKLVTQGYDTCQLMIDPQTGGLQEVKPLCEIVK